MFQRIARLRPFLAGLLVLTFLPIAALGQQRTPTDTVRDFYQFLRDKKFREAFALSIYAPAVDGLSKEDFEDLRPDFEKMALAVTEKMPAKVSITGEQISGDVATVFVHVLDADGKDKIESASLLKIQNVWIVGDRESQQLVLKEGKKFFFEARINAHHNDVQDMMTRITLAQVAYSQSHDGKFGNLQELISAGFMPKDIEATDSTGYRFQVVKSADAKTWYATAEPAQYGRTGRLSFHLDATGVRSGDTGGKPLLPKK